MSATAYSDEARIPVSHADEGEFVSLVMARFELTHNEAEELLSLAEEHLASRIMAHPQAPSGISVIRRGWRVIMCASTYRQQAFLMRIFGRVMGLGDEFDGKDTMAQIGSKFGLSKADASKFSCLFRDGLPATSGSLPTMPGQRDDKARAKFARKRLEQEHARRKPSTTGNFDEKINSH